MQVNVLGNRLNQALTGSTLTHVSLVREIACKAVVAGSDSPVRLYTRVTRLPPKDDQGNGLMGVRISSRVR